MMRSIIDKLARSDEPSVRFKVLVNVLGKELESVEIIRLQQEIKSSPRVRSLLSERGKDGRIPFHPYAKWYGAHWILAGLADIGYPPGDESLIPLREQVYQWLLSKKHEKRIKSIEGRVRRCASQEGNALYSLLSLGLADARIEELAERLMKWQWTDGGWNCDKNPKAINSSFMESLIPLRGLALYGRLTGDEESKKAAGRAAQIFLKRKLFKRQRNGEIISDDFVKLHYPCYWHYDILFGLKVMAKAGFIGDERCYDALELLESKRLPDGGFPAEKKYYQFTERIKTGRSLVDWGGTSKKNMNEFVTADVLYVLKKSGRLS
ncbi:MAG: hypothetical protein GH144_04340 [Clostridia bacterium]|jgi:hypothetical protein|nr:hypothetical protein [Clostridia bacterium]